MNDPFSHRQLLPSWPDEWRERWGRRANELQDAGVPWPDHEGQAFEEVLEMKRTTPTVPPAPSPPPAGANPRPGAADAATPLLDALVPTLAPSPPPGD